MAAWGRDCGSRMMSIRGYGERWGSRMKRHCKAPAAGGGRQQDEGELFNFRKADVRPVVSPRRVGFKARSELDTHAWS